MADKKIKDLTSKPVSGDSVKGGAKKGAKLSNRKQF